MATYSDINPVFRSADSSLTGYSISEDIDAIKNSITNIFLVRLGELPGKPWFGNGLWETLFEPIDIFTVKILREHITSQVRRFDERISIDDIVVTTAPEFNSISVDIRFSVNIEGSTYNNNVILKDLSSLVTIQGN